MGHGEKADAWDMMAVTTPLPSSWESHADVVVPFVGGQDSVFVLGSDFLGVHI